MVVRNCVPLQYHIYKIYTIMNIKRVIRDNGFTLSHVAAQLGISQPSLTEQIINGTIAAKRLIEIAHIINCSPSALLQDVDEDDTLYITCPHCRKRIRIRVDDADQSTEE